MRRNGSAYQPAALVKFEEAVKSNWAGPKVSSEKPCYVIIELDNQGFDVEVGVLGNADHPRYIRGDLDNYVKAILDGLKGAAYADDKQVWTAVVVIGRNDEFARQASEALRGE